MKEAFIDNVALAMTSLHPDFVKRKNETADKSGKWIILLNGKLRGVYVMRYRERYIVVYLGTIDQCIIPIQVCAFLPLYDV